MTTTFNGTTGITYPDGSTQASAQVGMKNRLIDAGFIINQRGYVSGTALSAGTYAHDRWKAGSGGGTYTFTQGSTGVPIAITITSGTLVQVIEGCNMGEGGTYTFSWSGTAQARVNGGSYAASPIVVTGLTAGANLTVEVAQGTFGYPQLEKGSTATSFDYRPYGTELALCQRYYYALIKGTGYWTTGAYMYNGTTLYFGVKFPVTMRTAPTVASTSGTNYYGFIGNNTADDFNSMTLSTASPDFIQMYNNTEVIGATNATGAIYSNTASSFVAFSAEL